MSSQWVIFFWLFCREVVDIVLFKPLHGLCYLTMYEANVYYNKYTYVWIGVPALWLKAPDINKLHRGWKLTHML